FRDFDAENVPIKWYLGSAYNSLGNYGDAIKYMKEAYQISPNNALVMNNLGQIYFNAGESKKAIKVLKKALSYYPRFMEANVNISSCYYSLNDYYRAYKALLFIPMSKRTEVVKNNMNILAVKLGKKKSGRAKREMRAELNLEKPKEKIKK
ncbi:MAG: tetratricopeptide repeat protein, partial [Bacteroidales bacterium]|nr:tetratricopeptide repeat protein [Bacteroidales bacterium]